MKIMNRSAAAACEKKGKVLDYQTFRDKFLWTLNIGLTRRALVRVLLVEALVCVLLSHLAKLLKELALRKHILSDGTRDQRKKST